MNYSATTLKSLRISYLAVDCLYTKVKFIDPVCSTGLHIVGKMRCDANLKWKHTGKYPGKGRPRKFDGKVNIKADIDRFEYIGTLEDGVKIYTEVVYAPKFEREIRVVILWQQAKERYTILYSTDTQLDAKKIVIYYKARFQIEFVFRDAKQHTGLTDCQSRKKGAIYNHINAAFSTLNLLKIEDKQHANIEGERVISIASWKRRKFNQNFMKILFANLGLDLSCKKVFPLFQKLSDYGVIVS